MRGGTIQRMKFRPLLAVFALTSLLGFADTAQKPIQLNDILAWKRIQSQSVSSDGAGSPTVSPAEGNSEVVIRNLKDGKEQHFPIGEMPRADGPAGGPPGFRLDRRATW